MKRLSCGVTFLLAICAPAAAQNVFVSQGQGRMQPARCTDVASQLKAGAGALSVCFDRGNGAPRCQLANAAEIDVLCTAAAGKPPSPGFLKQFQAIALDTRQGIGQIGGRKATDVVCIHPLPQGELLLPNDELRLLVSPDSPAFQNLALGPDAAGARAVPVAADFAAGRAGIDGRALRDRAWLMTARSGNESAVCKFKVLGGEEARGMLAQYRQLTQDGEAGLIEKAYFFRQNELWFEYRQAIDALRLEGRK